MRTVVLSEPGPLLDTIFTEILTPAFHPAELVPIDGLRDGLRRHVVDISTIVDEEMGPQAVAVGDWFAGSRVALLSYLATRPDARSMGLGSRLLGAALARWRERWHPRLTVVEIEHPGAGVANEWHGDPLARSRFYARHGARPLALPYFQPQVRPGAGRVYGLMLCVLDMIDEACGPRPDTVDGHVLSRFLTEYLDTSEGTDGTDPEAQALLSAAGDTDGVRMLSFDGLDKMPVATAPQ